jgi:superfamily II DNA or RNA helicase
VDVSTNYEAFLRAKATPGVRFTDDGHAILPPDTDASDQHHAVMRSAPHLHEYQAFCAAFALARKRSALFLECGLGKTSISLAWASAIGGAVAVCAPLAACYEYLDEAERFFPGIQIELLRGGRIDQWLRDPSGIGVMTHHAMIRERDLTKCRGIVTDESSILKSGDGAIAKGLKSSSTPLEYRLALSATPAPNDPTEYAAHATWLGHVKTDAEFRARFFVRDGKFWRVKNHAAQEMPRWLSAWAVWMRDPASYGMSCDAAIPEPFDQHIKAVPSAGGVDIQRDLLGIPLAGMTMSDRATLRRAMWSDDARMDAVLEEVTEPSEGSPRPSIVWGRSNAHCDAMERAIRAAGVSVAQIAGKTGEDERVEILRRYRRGEIDCIVSKPKVIGHGVNLQRADLMVWAGYDESYEAQHQSIRRAHRQGREGSLRVVYIVSPDERGVMTSLATKAEQWDRLATIQEREMQRNLSIEVDRFKGGEGVSRVATATTERKPTAESEWYTMHHGDCIEVMRDEMETDSMDLAVFSPPFAALFAYSSEPEDMGNCSEHDTGAEFGIHFRHFARELLRVMKPGRVVCLHLQQLVAFRASAGRKGLRDFRGGVVSTMETAGFHFYGEFVIPKNPQAAAIRTKSERLQFSQFKRDSLESSPCLNDYMLEFRKPGKQSAKVSNDVSNEEWIRWASGVWDDIRESDVLSGYRAARGGNDEKHVCPLQLEVIRRCVRLWSNTGETVFSPFAGIGSEPFVAIEQGRKGYGIELKTEYFDQAVGNCDMSVARTHHQGSLL